MKKYTETRAQKIWELEVGSWLMRCIWQPVGEGGLWFATLYRGAESLGEARFQEWEESRWKALWEVARAGILAVEGVASDARREHGRGGCQ